MRAFSQFGMEPALVGSLLGESLYIFLFHPLQLISTHIYIYIYAQSNYFQHRIQIYDI